MFHESIRLVLNMAVAIGTLLAASAAFWNGKVALEISKKESDRHADERRERERVTACFVRADVTILQVRLPKASSSLRAVLAANSNIERSEHANNAILEFNFINDAVGRLTLEKIGALPEGVAHHVAEAAGALPLFINEARKELRKYQDNELSARDQIERTARQFFELADGLTAFSDYFGNEFKWAPTQMR